MNLQTIFSSSRRKCLVLKNMLSSQGLNVPNHNNEDSSTRSTPYKISSSSKTKNCLYFLSPHHHPPHSKDCSSLSNIRKEILGSPKTLGLPSCNNILEITLGNCKTYVFLTLTHPHTVSPRLKLQNTEILPSRLDLRHQDMPGYLVQLQLGVGG